MTDTTRELGSITEGMIWKRLLLFFFPILLGTFFQQLYNTVDAIIVGQYVGKEALASVGGATGTLIDLLVGFFVGISSGATVIIAQKYGARDSHGVHKAVHTGVALALAGGALLTVVGLVIVPFALKWMGTPKAILPQATTYLRVYFIGMIPSMLYNLGAGILRAVGDSRRPLYFLILSCLTNIGLDLLFVRGFKMGVAGVAIATILAQTLSATLVVITLVRSQMDYKLHLRSIGFDPKALAGTLRIGLPAGLQSTMYSISNIIIQTSVNTFGTDSLAAWTAYSKIDGIFWMTMGAFGVATTTFIGQNFGAQKYDRMRKTVRTALCMAFGITIVITCALLLIGQYIFAMFTNDAAVLEIGLNIMYNLIPFYFTYVCVEILASAVRGTGDSIVPMVLTCVGICVMRVLWVSFVVPVHHDLVVVALAYPLTWAITSVLFVIYYLHGGWLKRRIAVNGFAPEIRPTKT